MRTRRQFIRDLGVSAAVLPFLGNLPSLAFANGQRRKQRLVVMFTPNGVVPGAFWPEAAGDLKDVTLKASLEPLTPFKDKLLTLHGVCDRVRGDGDAHMRGMGCLLTGIELFPGNVQGGSDTPAGWARGISIDQEIKAFLQSNAETRTRFGSLEFGVMVPNRADTWTRMSYAGANRPISPIDDPYQMFAKLYGRSRDREAVQSVLDDLQGDLRRLSSAVGTEDRRLIDEHATFVREMERELRNDRSTAPTHAMPALEPNIRNENDNMPRTTRMQMELLVNSLANDFCRVATFQFTNSVGMARMRWLNVTEGHHELSHKPDNDAPAQDQLTRINKWFAEQLAFLAKRLAETPEPGGQGSLLDNTQILWTNELGKGNSHTLDNIPFVMVGGGLNLKMGRSMRYSRVPHNRLLLSLAHGFGHRIRAFGNSNFCGDGPLSDLT
ncbi:MAG: DUF1552 domain-containing protein [Gemmataceae bacterium]|nr:DUF1552 domain-containing protein [Gemmataceae bacterium]